MTEIGTDDKWEFYEDHKQKHHKWRWRRTARNGRIVGASTQGHADRFECVENAVRNGFVRENQS